MAYRYGNRDQVSFLPPSVEEYVTADDPVRAYDAFIDSIDLEKIGIKIDPDKVGNSEYDPSRMLKLFTYGYSYGWKSARKLERAIHHNLSFIWLMGGLKPDFKTIAEFRRKNKKAIKKALRHCAKLCIKLNLIDGNILFSDGTKIRANAGRGKNYKKSHYEKLLSEVDARIDRLLEESERIDKSESNQGSFVKMQEELAGNEVLRTRIKEIMDQFEEEGEKTQNGKDRTINLTDPDSSLMRSIQGSHASFNIQGVFDDKHGLIVNMDTVSDTSDVNQFANQIKQAEEVTGKECEVACADAGYADTVELSKISERGTKVIVPSQRQASHNKADDPFSKSKFKYNQAEDCYYCPAGHRLRFTGKDSKHGKLHYRIKNKKTCQRCKHYGSCTKSKNGRKIVRLVNEEIKAKLEKAYEEGQEIYKRRKTRAEHPFGHIKHNLGLKNFLLRGREGVQAEISFAAICFNISRMLTIFGGTQEFISKLANLELEPL